MVKAYSYKVTFLVKVNADRIDIFRLTALVNYTVM